MQKETPQWVSILLLLCILAGAGLYLLSALGLLINAVYLFFLDGADPTGPLISAAAAGFEGAFLVLCAWFVIQKVSGNPNSDKEVHYPHQRGQVTAVILSMVTALTLGSILVTKTSVWLSWTLLPLFTLAAILPPIWLLAGLGTRRLSLGARWRVWAIVGLGMTLNPLIMVILEVLVGLFSAALAVLLLATQPDLVNQLVEVLPNLDPQTDAELFVNLVAPYVLQPAVIAVILGYIALFVPMIEELFKPFGVWLFAAKIESPAQGFALGLLSGAAYAAVESLGASGRGGLEWPLVVAARFGTSLLHITTSGLMGWAIVSTGQDRRLLRLLATYGIVVLIHGVWNASAAGTGLAALGDFVGRSESFERILLAALGGLTTLSAGMLALLFIANRKLGRTVQPREVTGQISQP